jgi:hypothetical protein
MDLDDLDLKNLTRLPERVVTIAMRASSSSAPPLKVHWAIPPRRPYIY